LIFPILLLPRSFRFIFLVVASIGTCFSNEGDPRVSHPWVYDCAKTGIGDLQLPPSGSAIEMLLSCMIDQALTDRYNESELNFRHEDIDWCLPSSFLDRSCFSSGFDPHYYLIHCLFQNPTLGSFYFEDETGNTEPFVDDKIVIGPALIVSLCDLINGLRSPKGVSCLFELCQTVSEAPSGVPSHTPSLNPTVEPSTAPSDLESESPSATASKLPSFNPTEARSTPFMETPLGDELTLRYPPLVVSIEILLEFVLLGVAKDLSSPPPKVFLDVLTIGVNNILVANVKGHVLTDILRVNAIKGVIIFPYCFALQPHVNAWIAVLRHFLMRLSLSTFWFSNLQVTLGPWQTKLSSMGLFWIFLLSQTSALKLVRWKALLLPIKTKISKLTTVCPGKLMLLSHILFSGL
jgi:hypothetical protein